MEKFIGTGVAVITPFTREKKLDEAALQGLLNYIIDGGVEYVVMLGTTAESVTLSKEEKNRVIQIAKETVAGRVPIVMGLGGNNTQALIDEISQTDFDGIDAILSVSPYYNKPSQRGIYYHYKTIAQASPVPVILYNVPGRTGSNITAETTLKLAQEVKNIIAIKEASGNFEQCMEIIKNKPKDFLVISGDDLYTMPFISMGMSGVISVVANGYPREFSDMVRASLKADIEKAKDLHYKLFEITRLLFAEGNPGGIKALLELKGLCKNELRLPMYPVSDDLYSRIKKHR